MQNPDKSTKPKLGPTWREMKIIIENQKKKDPQRGTLNERAWMGVEEGLARLQAAGWGFEIAPKGTLEAVAPELLVDKSLSIADAQTQLNFPVNEQKSKFDAMTAQGQI